MKLFVGRNQTIVEFMGFAYSVNIYGLYYVSDTLQGSGYKKSQGNYIANDYTRI